jgi:hypothetical protein
VLNIGTNHVLMLLLILLPGLYLCLSGWAEDTANTPVTNNDANFPADFDVGQELKENQLGTAWKRWFAQFDGACRVHLGRRVELPGSATVKICVDRNHAITIDVVNYTGSADFRSQLVTALNDLGGNVGLTFPVLSFREKVSFSYTYYSTGKTSAAMQKGDSSTQPYEFKGTALGIQIDAWKKAPYPVDAGGHVSVVADKTPADRRVYSIKMRNANGEPVPITVAYQECVDASWMFLPDVMGTYRLGVMQFVFRSDAFALVHKSLTDKFGEAEVIMKPGNRSCLWSNGVSSIVLCQRYSTDDVLLSFLLNGLLNQAKSKSTTPGDL